MCVLRARARPQACLAPAPEVAGQYLAMGRVAQADKVGGGEDLRGPWGRGGGSNQGAPPKPASTGCMHPLSHHAPSSPPPPLRPSPAHTHPRAFTAIKPNLPPNHHTHTHTHAAPPICTHARR